ncbi:response regulator transcription factor [uncultured Acetatifactor sp.]|uniref:response regulator transcription factor n=1 Tax=uncultured Acetatifactor sp. TaxID=1671927 RepID=UPI00262A89EE|nr:response regulator transcription factor [uncultured Acetatifactor sp.]
MNEKTYRILIVEDDKSISDLLCMNLSVAGYHCDAAEDGKQAVQMIHGSSYDLAILDIMLPEIDGFALYEHMSTKGIPVIYLSAKTDIQSKVKGLRIGAEDYLTKPFEVLELLVRVEKVLKRNECSQNVYRMDNVAIHEKEHMVLLDGNPVELKPMEYSLLLMLVRHPNMVFSREQLLQEVWGDWYFGETRTVDNHIAILRKKLNWSEKIVTVHRVGYKLEVR